ncbi:MAG TPA: aminotransferase [Desulfobacteraceae bacterium]|nr:aminotransferase [Desulfobacteraceae bacterium]
MIPNQRHLFSIPEDVTYLNCAYTAPLMKTAEAAGRRAVTAKAHPWQITPAHFFSTIAPVKEKFARLVNCTPRDVAIIPAVSYGIAVAAKNLPLSAGEEILVLDEQFPSNVYVWQKKAVQAAGKVTVIQRPEDHDWTRAVIEAISKKTAIAALPHCHWTDGSRLDLEAVGQRCREVGAALCIDATQSLGALPLDINVVQPDFLLTTAHKWLLGPYSLGFAYVAPQWQAGSPLEENWLNRKGSEDFSRLVDYRDEYQPGAARFDMGAASQFVLAPVADAALAQILDWGVAQIASTLSARITRVAELSLEMGLNVLPSNVRSPHMTGIGFPDGLPEGLGDALACDRIFVSIRGTAVRVAPHLYTGDGDILRLVEVLRRFAG